LKQTSLVVVFAILESVLAIGCSSARTHAPQLTAEQSLSASAPAGWHKIEAVAFSLFAPSGWEFHQSAGIDSYIGEFVGNGAVLKFDFGGYSSGCFDKAKKPAYVIEHKSIGGFRAKIASPRTPGHGFTGIYFPNVARSTGLCLWGEDLTSAQQEVVLRIFETIRFEHFESLILNPPPPPPKNPQ
jgi:hypothetical protein